MRPAIGLDFGTSTTLVASPSGVVPIGEVSAWMPSLVGYDDEGQVVVGELAQDVPDEQMVRSIKRLITDGRSVVRLQTPTGLRDVPADDLIVKMLQEAATRSAASGQDMTGPHPVRLGCPAMWDGKQRRRLVELARRAGLPVTLANIVDEPVAAGIAWLAGRKPDSSAPMRVVVFDMGGGTLDIAVLDVRGSQHRDVSVLAAIGVAEAGDTLDDAITEDMEYVLAAAGVDIDSLERPRRARARLAYAARAAKIGLSTETEVDVKLSRREFGISSVVYRRSYLDQAFAPQMDRAEQYVAAALRAAHLAEMVSGSVTDILRMETDELTEKVDVVVLSGGMSQIPYVAQRMAELFPAWTRVEMACEPSDNAVALGLAKAGHYGRINMYRPAFDILLEWDSKRETRKIYEAYTPLIEGRQIARGGSDLRFVRTGQELSLPDGGSGKLRLVSHSGEKVRASLAGTSLEGFRVALSEQKFEFSIYPNGRLRLTDADATYDGHIEDWHALQDTAQ
ncbi:Hsp70 family protein [Rhizocola hellebori]|uniref:Hsp70 family protein n=1 Tax=Rhizocola hellebori TaxID=1392758 RepID=UPI001EF1AFC8|nr:Hsp70 family protein [Rhizocola hellebori]